MVELEISVITDEFSEEFDEVCEYVASQEVKYVELRKVWMGNILAVDDTLIGDARDILKDNGLKVSNIAGPILKCQPPSENPNPTKSVDYTENWQYNYSLIDRAIEMAEFFNAPYIRCFAYEGKWAIKPVEEWKEWPIYQDWSKIVTEMKKKVCNKGKMLLCENDSGFNTSFDQIERIAKDHVGDGFGMLFDTANIINHDGLMGILDDEWLVELGKYIQYIHAKGCKMGSKSFETTFVNDEEDRVGWSRIINYFRNMIGEDFVAPAPQPMFLSIETHMGKKNMWDNSAKSLKNLQTLLNE